MTHTVNVTKIIDGSRYAVLHVFVEGDGQSADLENSVLLDPSEDEVSDAVRYVLEKVEYDLYKFMGRIEFDTGGVTPNLILVMTPNGGNCVDFREDGGLKDRINPLTGTGKVLFSTVGLNEANAQGSFVMKFRKVS